MKKLKQCGWYFICVLFCLGGVRFAWEIITFVVRLIDKYGVTSEAICFMTGAVIAAIVISVADMRISLY